MSKIKGELIREAVRCKFCMVAPECLSDKINPHEERAEILYECPECGQTGKQIITAGHLTDFDRSWEGAMLPSRKAAEEVEFGGFEPATKQSV